MIFSHHDCKLYINKYAAIYISNHYAYQFIYLFEHRTDRAFADRDRTALASTRAAPKAVPTASVSDGRVDHLVSGLEECEAQVQTALKLYVGLDRSIDEVLLTCTSEEEKAVYLKLKADIRDNCHDIQTGCAALDFNRNAPSGAGWAPPSELAAAALEADK